MKINKLIIATFLLITCSSCNDWLEVKPKDSVTEDELFATGEGYRNALQGVYRQMASFGMYGREMTWGMLDVMGQMYATTRGTLSSSSPYYVVANSYNYANINVKPIMQNIWSTAYNSIANCNNLLSRVEKADPLLFDKNELEKNLIQGEALALRAILHFDMLRLFAPAPNVAEANATYIPYFETYPSIFEANLSVNDVLEKVVRDLLAAKDLLESFDTIPEHNVWLEFRYRIQGGGSTGSSSEMSNDLFYSYRGYRLNYYAITALLARVYSYANKYQEAFEQTEEVINAKDEEGYNLYEFTDYYSLDEDHRMQEEVLFALSNAKLIETYATYNDYNAGRGTLLALKDYTTMFDDGSDARKSELTEKNGSNNICNKYLFYTAGNDRYGEDLIPMIRLSELYYIQAEYYYNQKNYNQATIALDKVRGVRNCTQGKLDIRENTFVNELLKEVKREFMGEGLLFYYYKKYNVKPLSSMNSSAFIVPLPENETIH